LTPDGERVTQAGGLAIVESYRYVMEVLDPFIFTGGVVIQGR
jgi:hypothetical protein